MLSLSYKTLKHYGGMKTVPYLAIIIKALPISPIL